jgi:hypothetical protein
MRQGSLQGGIQVRHPESEADPATDPPTNFDPIDRGRLLFVKDLQGGAAEFQDQRTTLVLGPDL